MWYRLFNSIYSFDLIRCVYALRTEGRREKAMQIKEVIKIEAALSKLLSEEFLENSETVSKEDSLVCSALREVINLRKFLENRCIECKCNQCIHKKECCNDCTGNVLGCTLMEVEGVKRKTDKGQAL